jgi:plastocyanin
MMVRNFAIVGTFMLAAACGRSPAAPSVDGMPLSPSAAPAPANQGAPAATAAVRGREEIVVNMQDACDPDTFNAALGAGTCLRSGGMKFDLFIAQLTRLGSVGAWHFAPPVSNVQVGQTFVVTNRGGEEHTFTEVAKFGGGIVPVLNTLSNAGDPAPECLALDEDDRVAPGGTYRETVDHAGPAKYQCCIHPWMRLEAKAAAH